MGSKKEEPNPDCKDYIPPFDKFYTGPTSKVFCPRKKRCRRCMCTYFAPGQATAPEGRSTVPDGGGGGNTDLGACLTDEEKMAVNEATGILCRVGLGGLISLGQMSTSFSQTPLINQHSQAMATDSNASRISHTQTPSSDYRSQGIGVFPSTSTQASSTDGTGSYVEGVPNSSIVQPGSHLEMPSAQVRYSNEGTESSIVQLSPSVQANLGFGSRIEERNYPVSHSKSQNLSFQDMNSTKSTAGSMRKGTGFYISGSGVSLENSNSNTSLSEFSETQAPVKSQASIQPSGVFPSKSTTTQSKASNQSFSVHPSVGSRSIAGNQSKAPSQVYSTQPSGVGSRSVAASQSRAPSQNFSSQPSGMGSRSVAANQSRAPSQSYSTQSSGVFSNKSIAGSQSKAPSQSFNAQPSGVGSRSVATSQSRAPSQQASGTQSKSTYVSPSGIDQPSAVGSKSMNKSTYG